MKTNQNQRVVGWRSHTATSDQALLDSAPSFLSIRDLFKATPAAEGSKRFIYLEASNQTHDLQGEVLLAKALEESAEYFQKFGNLDLEHMTQIGARQGIPNHESYDIGKPVSVGFDAGRTFVKGQVYTGAGPAAEKANMFWSSLTDIKPPKAWYPSVGGAVMAKSIAVDHKTGEKYPIITKVRWTNVGFSLTPVNPNLATVSTVPIGVLSKCWSASGIDMRKSRNGLTGSLSISKQDILAKAIHSMEEGVITGFEAAAVECALNMGIMPQKDVLNRIFGENH